MKNLLFAAVAVLGLATAIPAFADSGDGPAGGASANSLPPGFYNDTPFGIHARIVGQYFANKGESSWLVLRGVIPPLPPQAQSQTPAHAQTQPQNHG
jgi:hypothetical protein